MTDQPDGTVDCVFGVGSLGLVFYPIGIGAGDLELVFSVRFLIASLNSFLHHPSSM